MADEVISSLRPLDMNPPPAIAAAFASPRMRASCAPIALAKRRLEPLLPVYLPPVIFPKILWRAAIPRPLSCSPNSEPRWKASDFRAEPVTELPKRLPIPEIFAPRFPSADIELFTNPGIKKNGTTRSNIATSVKKNLPPLIINYSLPPIKLLMQSSLHPSTHHKSGTQLAAPQIS